MSPEDQHEEIVTAQTSFFEDKFKPQILRYIEGDQSFIGKFIQCATGSRYLGLGHVIKIEFNHKHE